MSTTTDTPRAIPASPDAPAVGRAAEVAVAFGDRLYRLSVEQYNRMAESGILTKDDRTELIEGLLVRKMTRNERHITTTWIIQQTFGRALPEGYLVGKEDPILLPRSEPEPDVSILKGRISDYFRRKPRADDALLVVEVADSTYTDDFLKLGLYAEALIPVCWIVHLPARRIEVFSDPTGPDPRPAYRARHDYGINDLIPLIVEGREIARLPVVDLLPPEAD